jgi:hypothetical protein
MESNMEKDFIHMQIKMFILVNGLMVENMDKELMYLPKLK